MTHFTVLVVGDNVEEQLLPYHEFECTGFDNQYVQDIDVTEDFNAQFQRDKEDGYATISEYLTEYRGINIINNMDELDLKGKHKYGYALMDGDKIIKVVCRTNPNRKWGWWVEGGRWTGFFTLKDGSKSNSAKKSDIDFDKMLQKTLAPRLDDYHLFSAYKGFNISLNTLRKNFKTWEQLRLDSSLNIEQRREIYNAQELVKVFKQLLPDYWGADDDIISLEYENYLEKETRAALKTHAMVINSQWHQKGQMGWFACSDETEDSTAKYYKFFESTLNSLPDDTLLTLVDCHI